MILLDSSALIELLRGTNRGTVVQEKIADEEIAVSAISIHEVLRGVPAKERDEFDALIHAVHVLPFDEATAEKSVDIEHALKSKGLPIGILDNFIAATCLVHQLPILTCDADFKRVKGLTVVLVK